jgi:predicted small metal-binding protein
MKTFRYYWQEDTINHFQAMSTITSGEEVYEAIQEYVENECQLEENEVNQDLIDDLVAQIGL